MSPAPPPPCGSRGTDARRPHRRARAGEAVRRYRGSVATRAVHALAALGADDVWTLGGACRGVLSRWRGDAAGFTDYELLGCTPARAVTRGAVARCLIAHAMHAGADVIATGPVSGEQSRDRWSLISGQHPERERISCRHLIDATGRSGRPIAALPVRYHHDRAVCLSTRHAAPLVDPTLLLVDRSTHGWWYAIAAGEGATDVAFVTDADLLPHARDRATWLAAEYREATLITSNLEGSPGLRRADESGCTKRSPRRALRVKGGLPSETPRCRGIRCPVMACSSRSKAPSGPPRPSSLATTNEATPVTHGGATTL